MKEKQIAIIGNLLFLWLVLYPRVLDIILASGFLDTQCSGALVRPSFLLLANGIIQIILFVSAFLLITLYLLVGELKLLWGHLSLLTLSLLWFLFWSIIGILSIVFKSDSCSEHEINYIMFLWIGFNISYEAILILLASVFVWGMGLFTGYRSIADNTNSNPYSDL